MHPREDPFWLCEVRKCVLLRGRKTAPAWPEKWIAGVNNSRHVINFHSGIHPFRLVGLDTNEDLRGSGLFFFHG